ncbi:MAG: DUF4133 domain-containing protein [Terrimonas sp.]|nr:DUF4133 domain-containing protein [Terrimonas sp.]OJY97916.1 MAG: hypothetical protein BGP13_09615 [Sphingobacteriales bacterium 40-81]
MANSVYQINKGINRSIEFKGLKAQYIWWLGGVVIGLLVLFAVLYIIGVNTFICLGIVAGAGIYSIMKIYAISSKYGEHGMMKKVAKRNIPGVIKSRNRKVFTGIKKQRHG